MKLWLPPNTLTVVPVEVNGDLVSKCITPEFVFGPYRAAPGPSTNSIDSMSSLVCGMKCNALARSDGMLVMRLSVSTSNDPEKMLLKPRVTTVCEATPCWAMSTAVRPFT